MKILKILKDPWWWWSHCSWLYNYICLSRVSSINKTDRHITTELLLKVALNTIILTLAL